jgi:hypothetical protein
MAKMSKDVVPFEGAEVLDTEPVFVTNPFSGDGCELTPVAVTVYDIIMGAERFGAYKTVQIGCEWFRRFYPREYMILLD